MTALLESFDMIIFAAIIVWGNHREHSLAKSPLTSLSLILIFIDKGALRIANVMFFVCDIFSYSSGGTIGNTSMHDSRGGSSKGVSLRDFIMYLRTNGSYAIYCKELKHALEGLKHSLDTHVF